jgi:hypothetical protein
VACTAHPVSGAVGAPRVLGNVLRFLPKQTKMEKQRPQARKNGFRFAIAPLLGRSGVRKNVRRVRRATSFRLWRPRNGQRTFNSSHFCTALRYRMRFAMLFNIVVRYAMMHRPSEGTTARI